MVTARMSTGGVEALGGDGAVRRRVDLVIAHATELLTCAGSAAPIRGEELSRIEILKDGAVAVRDGRIVAVGPTPEVLANYAADATLNAAGRLVTPGLVDAHTHLVYGGTRHADWEDLAVGRPATGLGGGIMRTVRATRELSADQLRVRALRDLDVMLAHGTTTVEAKTGYGLDGETELRLLEVMANLRHEIPVVATYLGAHLQPTDYPGSRADYLKLVRDLLPEAAKYAEYCDMACDPACFTAEECAEVATVARAAGMRLRLHADQTGDAGGVALAAQLGASSVDHLDAISAAGRAALASSPTVGMIFPGVSQHMLDTIPAVGGGQPSQPDAPGWVRQLIDSGAALGLATDYNPGTCPTPSMQTVMQLAARLYRLSYAEIWQMCTINAAHSLDRGGEIGSLEPGKRADILVWSVPEHGMPIHRFGVNLVDTVLIAGKRAQPVS
ncbi:imidazolonepropionase [Tamaricihabitans halophyticus]|uniref:Imidazolonepropionase n=1 Tax=Tamaricihabitans halophyticus TaxID=1262583 RepID=A0A4V2SRG3_9PSEU|nr:imidazolonepropionase [Tamaricihabitans halophyticus]TCP42626.1 imidazolonepropionase [Tamaricihabitans halophyticus]